MRLPFVVWSLFMEPEGVTFAISLGFILLNIYLAHHARNVTGHFWPWFLLLFVFPVFTHIFVLGLLVYVEYKKSGVEVLRDVMADTGARTPVIAESGDRIGSAASVTPFGEPDETAFGPVAAMPDILAQLRDKKIDELMEWKEWSKAYEVAGQRLESAREIGDYRSIELYETYIRLIKPHVSPIN